MKKIIIISEFVSKYQNSTGYFWEIAINYLVNNGKKIEIITNQGLENKNVKQFLVKRVIDKFTISLRLAYKGCVKIKKGDIVLSGTNPELLLLFLSALKKLIRFRWVVVVHDVFPENLVPAGVLSKNTASYKLVKYLFDCVFRQVDKFIVIGRDMKILVDGKTNQPDKSIYVSNWVNSDDIVVTDKNKNDLILRLNLQEKIVFQYFGNIGRLQDIDVLLRAIELIKSNKAAFIFIGDGASAAKVRDFEASSKNKFFFYLGSVDQNEKNKYLSACDVSLVSLREGMFGLGVPSKAYFSLAADRPILAVVDKGSELELMVNEHNVGWVSPPGDPVILASKIDEICETDLSKYKGHMRSLSMKLMKAEYSLKCLLDALEQ